MRVIDDRGLMSRPRIGDALKAWDKTVGNGPLVLIATAGGASRAGYWTGAVLRALDDATGGEFSKHVFAISSVSGGSLAAVGYAARTADHPPSSGGYNADSRRKFDKEFLGADYLSPAIAGMLFPDFLQRFLPGVPETIIPELLPSWIRRPLMFPDRAESLEEWWEIGWKNAVNAAASSRKNCDEQVSPCRMEQDFLRIWENSALYDDTSEIWVPLVLINGTMMENGKRIITAPVKVESAVFEDSFDFFDLVEQPIRASTAILNGARFPVVSPAGTLRNKASEARGRIVDGGYFENGGLETLYDLARHINRIDRACRRSPREILIIEIGNDVSDDAGVNTARHPNGGPVGNLLSTTDAPKTGAPALSEITSIIGGLYQTRTARGVLAAKRLSTPKLSNLGENVNRITFNLPVKTTVMSWTLSSRSRNEIDKVFSKAGGPFPREGEQRLSKQEKLVARQRQARDYIVQFVGVHMVPVKSECGKYADHVGVSLPQ